MRGWLRYLELTAEADHRPGVWIRIAAGEQVAHSMMRREAGERTYAAGARRNFIPISIARERRV
jgi:hypothetical protein